MRATGSGRPRDRSPLDPVEGRRLASAWTGAWHRRDVEAVTGLLHDDATLALPTGKIRADELQAAVADLVATAPALAATPELVALGIDVVTVRCAVADGPDLLDTLVVAEGRVVRLMRQIVD